MVEVYTDLLFLAISEENLTQQLFLSNLLHLHNNLFFDIVYFLQEIIVMLCTCYYPI